MNPYEMMGLEPTVRVFDESGHELKIRHKMWTKDQTIRVVVDLRQICETAAQEALDARDKRNAELVAAWDAEWKERQGRTVKFEIPDTMKVPDLPLPPAALTERKPDGTE